MILSRLEPAIRKLGYLHLAKDHTNPIDVLLEAISRRNKEASADSDGLCVSDALIVLPEAFNLGDEYETFNPCKPDPCILTKLQASCDGLNNVSFVVGVLMSPDGPELPYSSAYLVSPHSEPQLLCHKRCADDRSQKGGVATNSKCAPHYRCCEGNCDEGNI